LYGLEIADNSIQEHISQLIRKQKIKPAYFSRGYFKI